MIEYHRYAWKCPKCGKYNRVRGGTAKKIRRCRCGYKALIETAYVEVVRLVTQIIGAEELK